jgi:aminopeptidase
MSVMDARFEALADLAVFGANVQPGQTVAVNATIGQEEAARAIAVAAYERGARFVDVLYFDPYLKRARIEHADPDTLDFVPAWMGDRLEALAANGDARITLSGVMHPDAIDGLDPARLGRDLLPWLKQTGRIISERATNWCGIACPSRDWAHLVHPDLSVDEAYELLWQELWYVLRLDEPDPATAWGERAATLNRSAEGLNAQDFRAIELHGPGTELTVGLFPSGRWGAADFTTRTGLRHFPNLPTEEVFTSPDPVLTEGHVAATMPLVLRDGSIVRGLRVRFEGGRAVEIEADENVDALRRRTEIDEGGARLGELALVDGQGRIGPLGTVFYDTLLDENAVSHIALGSGFTFSVDDDADKARINESGIHIDFMIGSSELEVDGITAGGERVPVLRAGAWQV